MMFLTTHEQTLVADKYIKIQGRLKRFLYSSHDKKHRDGHILQMGVTNGKL